MLKLYIQIHKHSWLKYYLFYVNISTNYRPVLLLRTIFLIVEIQLCVPRSSIGTSLEVMDLSTGATTGPSAATAAPAA